MSIHDERVEKVQTKALIEIVGLSDLWLAWVKPNRMAAQAVAEVLSTFLTPEKVGDLVKEVLDAVAGNDGDADPNKAVKGLAEKVVQLMSAGKHDHVVRLCKLVLNAW